MKNTLILILLFTLFISNASAGQMEGFRKEQSLRVYKKKDLLDTEIKVQLRTWPLVIVLSFYLLVLTIVDFNHTWTENEVCRDATNFA
ncbi:MAG TPA: hypothetical protein DCE52_11490 [Rhodobacteraceae bacterium]|nr:hypothetical protein [Paracoccaceae bacterium]